MHDEIKILLHTQLKKLRPKCDGIGFRLYKENSHVRSITDGTPHTNINLDLGVCIEVFKNGHFSYAGTSSLTQEGITAAFNRALEFLDRNHSNYLTSFDPKNVRPPNTGNYFSEYKQAFDKNSSYEINRLLSSTFEKLKHGPNVISAKCEARTIETEIYNINSYGAETEQKFLLSTSSLLATGEKNGDIQTRTENGELSRCYQLGLEAFNEIELHQQADTILSELSELLAAEQCPTKITDLILAPDQMYMQIHESVGHPLELDRILGDERNFAGWSFVTPQDFENLKYGSELMNIVYEPHQKHEFASFNFDDSNAKTNKEYLIKDGILVRGLGGLESQFRSGLPGVSNMRASSWNRAPIDRMANINLEPGKSTLEEMIARVENGILMKSNRFFSIDDYRRKFQFSCEYGKLIRDGKIIKTVKNPSYRGVSIPFWQSLSMISKESETFGSPQCGKGEPSQVIRVGHASPYCLFRNAEVFGGLQ